MNNININNPENQEQSQEEAPKKKKPVVAIGVLVAIVTVAIVLIIVTIASNFLSAPKARIIPSLLQVTDTLQIEEQELAQIEQDFDIFAQDELVLDELEQTYRDVLDENPVVTTEDALNVDDINREAADADISGDLNAFAEDDAALDTLNPSFEEVLQ